MEQYNKIIRLNKMTYGEALHVAWEVLEEKRIRTVESDTMGLGLAQKYEDAITLLYNLFIHKMDNTDLYWEHSQHGEFLFNCSTCSREKEELTADLRREEAEQMERDDNAKAEATYKNFDN
jgi:hypothetical protein